MTRDSGGGGGANGASGASEGSEGSKVEIIVAVCGHPVLYDTTAVFYRDKFKKEEAFRPLSFHVVHG